MTEENQIIRFQSLNQPKEPNMLEACSFRRLGVTIFGFLLVSAMVLFLEDYYTDWKERKNKITALIPSKKRGRTLIADEKDLPSVAVNSSQTSNKAGNSVEAATSSELRDKCWLHEPFKVLEDCLPCTDFEKRAGHKAYCFPSGYYEKLECSESKTMVFRACPKVAWVEERNYNIFMTLSLAVSFVFTSLATLRQRQLDRQLFARIQQQIGSGV